MHRVSVAHVCAITGLRSLKSAWSLTTGVSIARDSTYYATHNSTLTRPPSAAISPLETAADATHATQQTNSCSPHN